ncbi:MAG: hypothetical protein AB7F19_01995 [Candidatus Babeliales bacterium]
MKKKVLFLLLFTSTLVISCLLLKTPSSDPYASFRKYPDIAEFLAKCEQTQSPVTRNCSPKEIKKYSDLAKELFNFQGIMSQSDGHLQQNACVAWDNIMTIVGNPAYKKVFDSALAHERYVANESAVFYHAQQNIYYWLELLYTKLWERKYNQPLSNYLFLRFPDEQNQDTIVKELQNGEQTRKRWLVQGRQKNHTAEDISPIVLGTNYALFANSKNHLCSTVQYFVHKFNDFDPKITTSDILAKFSTQDLYHRYKPLLDDIEHEFKKVVPQSVLLQIMIPFHLLKEHVYLSTQGSWKTSIYIHDKVTDDVYTILHTLKTAPAAFPESDTPVFRIIVTPDSLHILRIQGAHILIYGAFDKEKLQQIITKLEQLIERIAQENPELFENKVDHKISHSFLGE